MKDIFDIKDIMFDNFINQRFIILLFIILFVLLFVWFLILIYRKYKRNIDLLAQNELKKRKLKEKYLLLLKNIKSDDKERFFKLNLYIRDYLEKAGIIEKSTKKTRSELITGKKDLDEFFEICEKAEFGRMEGMDFEKIKKIGKVIISDWL